VLTILLLFASQTSNLDYLRCILLPFEATSSLRVNISKSALISIGEVPNVNVLAHFFGCEVDNLPFSHLGLPLGASYKSKVFWDLVIERLHERQAI